MPTPLDILAAEFEAGPGGHRARARQGTLALFALDPALARDGLLRALGRRARLLFSTTLPLPARVEHIGVGNALTKGVGAFLAH